MRARDRRRMDVLRGLLTAIKNAKVEKRVAELAEADLVGLVQKELKKRIETIAYAQQAGRPETVAQNEAEKAVIESYLPSQLDAEELESTIRRLAEELGTKQIGPLMAELRKHFGGQFDGKRASEVIRTLGE